MVTIQLIQNYLFFNQFGLFYILLQLLLLSWTQLNERNQYNELIFNGPKIFKYFGCFFTVTINSGLLAINLILNRTEQEHFIQIIQILVSLIIVYGPLEIIIQYNKLSYAFNISEQLRLDPFNPLINFIYYFFQDEIVISLVQGAILY